jgi:hypothetical protein
MSQFADLSDLFQATDTDVNLICEQRQVDSNHFNYI